MARKTGMSFFTPPPINGESLLKNITVDNLIRAVRVKSIVLDETHPRFKELGEWNGLGIIEYEDVENPLFSNKLPIAKPFYSNDKTYPLINEIVFLLYLPNTNIGQFTTSGDSYYMSVISLWNHPHHNAFPTNPDILPSSQQKDYIETEAGSVRRVTDQSTEIRLGKTFEEKTNIHPLLPFEGDKIIEGRWGNSIRFGSTNLLTNNNTTVNPKSDSFFLEYKFDMGDTVIPQSFKSDLSFISSQIKQFNDKYDNVSLRVLLNAGESLVPNPNNLPQEALANQRLQNLQNLLVSYPLINQNVTTKTTVGSTSYTRGIDNPLDPKYINEQFIRINVSINGQEIIKNPVNTKSLNTWSSGSISGSPITIIRNGQGFQSNEGWIPVIEDINNDDSSIYLTTTQQINLTPSSQNTGSYSVNPIGINQYTNPQIILNSGRLVFNSSQDHILLSSKNSIGLNAIESINIDTPKTIIQSQEIYLGGPDAVEPVLKGDVTIDLLSQLVQQLINLTKILKFVTPQGGPGVSQAVTALEPFLSNIKTQLETTTKSKVSKTK